MCHSERQREISFLRVQVDSCGEKSIDFDRDSSDAQGRNVAGEAYDFIVGAVRFPDPRSQRACVGVDIPDFVIPTFLISRQLLGEIVGPGRRRPDLDHQWEWRAIGIKRRSLLPESLCQCVRNDSDIRDEVRVARHTQASMLNPDSVIAWVNSRVKLSQKVIHDVAVLNAHGWLFP